MSESFQEELESLINRHSIENESDSPDFLLATFLIDCLRIYAKTVKARDKWYGFKGLSQRYEGKVATDTTEGHFQNYDPL